MKDKLNMWMKASRSRVLPVMILPVLIGAAGAFGWDGTFRTGLFLVTLIGAAAAHLFSNMINDLWDYRNGVDVAAKETAAAISTNSGFLTGGRIPEKSFATVTWAIFAVAFVCGAVLSMASGWWVLAFAVAGALIAYFYVAPPLKFGYRGKGYSELAILLSFGVLPVTGTYFVQTGAFDVRALWVSLPIGLLTTLVLFNHHFLHWQADKASGKRTLVVLWGEKRGLAFSKCLAAAAFIVLIGCVPLGALPWYSLAGLAGAAPLIKVYRQLGPENEPRAYLPLMGAALKAAQICGTVMFLSLLLQGMIP
ncbi:prenyltransferase [Paenibacillus thermotolerans]|uniref:prenyltransferase n=1 Tax=Paenibacillus thermotolerans TaxID=3027807 RepID=UPI002367A72F|nr:MULTISPECIES: prenyltransferase [unclassified Paenibacillus]